MRTHHLKVRSDSTLSDFDIRTEFARFQKKESILWNPPRPQEELVPPSGELDWPIAHHLHNPSFITQTPHTGETADPTSPCIALIMANTFVRGKTLIYDHIARREIVDGLLDYPEQILRCHEAWLSALRDNMLAKVEIVYGRVAQKRMLEICDFEQLTLWGEHREVTVYLEWISCDDQISRTLIRFLVFAMHPQVFLLPWGRKFAKKQDFLTSIAHSLASLNYNDGFYQNWDWSFINGFPKLQHYEQQQAMARDAFKAVQAAKDVGVSQIKLPQGSKILHRPNSWNAKRAVKRIILRDNNSFLATKPESLDSPLFDVLGSTILDELPPEVHLDFPEFLRTPQSEASDAGNTYLKQRSKNKEGT
jgi:hypothetical protein